MGISFVAAKKLILNVSKIRLRLIFSRASDLRRIFLKGLRRGHHLLRCIIKSVHPCTLLMANFGFAEISLLVEPVASVPLLKILNVSERIGMSVVPYISDVFALQKLAAGKCARMYICRQGIYPHLFKRLTEGILSKRIET